MRRAILSIAVLLLAGTSAWAQTRRTFRVTAGGYGTTLEPGHFGTAVPGLSGFALTFVDPTGGSAPDHKVKALSVFPEGNSVRFTLSDDDGKERFSGEGRFVDLGPGVTKHEAIKNCGKACDLQIPHPPKNQVFVLRGFEFRRPGANQNVKKISITPMPAQGVIRLYYEGGGDAVGMTQPDFGYEARIFYSYIAPTGVSSHTTSGDLSRANRNLSRKTGAVVLQGFSVEFTNGSHYLNSMSIIPGASNFTVGLRDKNADDPYRASIEYAILN